METGRMYLESLPVISGETAVDVNWKWRSEMLHYAWVFLIVALIAAVLGFWGVAGVAASFAKILFFVFLVIFLVSFLMGRRSAI
jgi:uncharacterized membrane protein YtjA (UPF0391 family)